MPRLDNSNPEVIEEYDLRFDPEDPGATEPVDVCMECMMGFWGDQEFECSHPPYEEQHPPYRCRDCGEILTEDDNGFM